MTAVTNTTIQICASAPALRPLVGFLLPRLLQTSHNYTSETGRRSYKIFSSHGGPSKASRVESRPYYGVEGSRGAEPFEILRTVEMKTWTESRGAEHTDIDHYELSSSHARMVTPTTQFDLKKGAMVSYTSPVTPKSSTSLHRGKTGSPFGDENSV